MLSEAALRGSSKYLFCNSTTLWSTYWWKSLFTCWYYIQSDIASLVNFSP